ncbi:putative mitochondrial pyruvate carrier 2 [Lasiodiplodia hormozganensis]|uniref:Mitochondrial pyruvate carrier n=1 Tax=Lasiodiplodia hormozganensis TaxID=869390 RepID=A0AA39Z0K9_9PEZI|nr:putative mitochondrial pyruvate carrier 2 [Lasiodiplodia hormozganensis]
MSAFRPTTRILNFSRNLVRNQAFRQTSQRRFQSTAAEANGAPQSGFAKFWNSPVGPKTVHFWAPVMKWGLVLAGVADFFRPAENLSLSQNCALMATGAIWTRWCLIIKPKNIFLATVNFFLGCVGLVQTSRILLWRSSQKGDSVTDEAKQAAKEEATSGKKILADPVAAAKDAAKN